MSVQEQCPDSALPKYAHPKILLMDLDEGVEITLRAEGWNVSSGSFGQPYEVPKDDAYCPVIVNGNLPSDYTEQEIIVVDLRPSSILSGPQGEKHTSPGEKDWWASRSAGVVDPRPRRMAQVQEDFDRILEHGGIFIIFAHRRYVQNVVWSNALLYEKRKLDYDNWSFLSIVDKLPVSPDYGREITVAENTHPLFQILEQHLDDATFTCTLEPHLPNDMWGSLAKNKYGADVGITIAPSGKRKGWVFIFPQVENKAKFLSVLLKNVIPIFAPQLFPHVQEARWLQRQEYQLPRVRQLQDDIHRIQEEARKQVVALEEGIEQERQAFSYLYDLLKETGDPLVSSVKKTLEHLGFQSVIDVDEELKNNGAKGTKREDLQIHDISPVLLLEVKGIVGIPKDAAALQVGKYLIPRMKEWSRTDIQGLAIINHQRNVPALERENEKPFREEILTNAQEQHFGLMTTWDLFRLARSYLKNNWKHEYIQALFYQTGRVRPVPLHYHFLGVVEQVWEKAGAVGVCLQEGELQQGDRIAFELPVEFEEQDVLSLQVDRQQVALATVGALAGIQTSLSKARVNKGTHVYRVVDFIGEAVEASEE